MPVERQVAIVWAGSGGYLDDIPVVRISAFEQAFLEYIETNYPKVYPSIVKEKAISPDVEKMLIAAVGECKKTFTQ